MSLPDLNEVESYIRQVAQQVGINPDIAVKVARSEGLAPGVWQSNLVMKSGKREPSYGPFQLYEGGGLGNKFKQVYGKSASDPSTWKQQVEFALGEAKKSGWSPWYGARKVGVGNFEGIRAGASSPGTPQGPVMSNGININTPEQTSYQTAYSPSQGPGEAQSLSVMDRLKNNKDNITDFIGAVDAMTALQRPAAPPPIAAPTGFAPLQIEGVKYTKKKGPDVSLLRQLGLI
jgi:hypothetical protein